MQAERRHESHMRMQCAIRTGRTKHKTRGEWCSRGEGGPYPCLRFEKRVENCPRERASVVFLNQHIPGARALLRVMVRAFGRGVEHVRHRRWMREVGSLIANVRCGSEREKDENCTFHPSLAESSKPCANQQRHRVVLVRTAWTHKHHAMHRYRQYVRWGVLSFATLTAVTQPLLKNKLLSGGVRATLRRRGRHADGDADECQHLHPTAIMGKVVPSYASSFHLTAEIPQEFHHPSPLASCWRTRKAAYEIRGGRGAPNADHAARGRQGTFCHLPRSIDHKDGVNHVGWSRT